MKKVLDNLYMFESKTNVLLYINGSECYLIDSGKSNKMKEEIKKYLSDNNLKLAGIINTHCHSDHVSNNDITVKAPSGTNGTVTGIIITEGDITPTVALIKPGNLRNL